MPAQQNDISSLYFKKPNLQDRAKQILEFIAKNTPFQVEQLLQKSAWWASPSIGAMHYAGTFNNQPVILKIQGVKPNISEAANIEAFAAQNQSKLVRPPKVFFALPWNEELRFEALIIESLEGEKLVDLPATQEKIQQFFSLYEEYRQQCIKEPWLDKPTISLAKGVTQAFAQWGKIRQELFPSHPLIKPGDEALIAQAIQVLVREYQDIDWQFQHGHFSARDVFPKNGQYILLSNLYWSWRLPHYDAVFGFHWYQFDLASLPETTPELLDQHRRWWKSEIQTAVSAQNDQEKRLLELAFLERAAAGLNLDGLIAPNAASEWLMETLRAEIQDLLT